MLRKGCFWRYGRRWLRNFSTEAQRTVTVPKRIKRSPTDLLEALSSTVGEDPTGYNHEFADDPYLLPHDTHSRRVYSLAKETGKRTARSIIEEWPTLFMYDTDEPRLEAFRPQKRPTDDDVVDLDMLTDRIEKRWVSNACKIYQNLRSEDTEVPVEVQLALLQLLCFYNSSEPDSKDSQWDIERRLYGYIELSRSRVPTITKVGWKDRGEADLLFDEMLESNLEDPQHLSCAYSTMLCGLVAYDRPQRAYKMYKEEMIPKNIQPTKEAYNALLDIAPKLAEDAAEKPATLDDDQQKQQPSESNNNNRRKDGGKVWEEQSVRTRRHDAMVDRSLNFIERILKEMADGGVAPDVITFNSALNVLRLLQVDADEKIYGRAVSFGLHCLREMVHLNVQPSLHTIAQLSLLTRHRFTDQHPQEYYGAFFAELLKLIENSPEAFLSSVKDEGDLLAFNELMNRTGQRGDLSGAYRINNIVNRARTYNRCLHGNYECEQRMYNHFLGVIAKNETMPKIMEWYNRLVPFKIASVPRTLLSLLDALEFNGSYELLPQFFKDIDRFEYMNNAELMQAVFDLLFRVNFELLTEDQHAALSWVISELKPALFASKRSTARKQTPSTTPKQLSDIAVLLTRSGNVGEGLKLFLSASGSTVGDEYGELHVDPAPTPPEDHFHEMVEVAGRFGRSDQALRLVDYYAKCEYAGLAELVTKVKKLLPLNQIQTKILDQFLSAGGA